MVHNFTCTLKVACLCVCLCVTLLALGLNVYGQSIPSVHYGVEDGLPTEELYDLCRDSTGYIWVGTAAGLVRFDGITFRQFDNRAARGLGFTNLRTDRYGRVWTQNFRGQLFYVENDSLHLAHDLGGLTDRFARFELGGHSLFLGTERQRLYRVDLRTLVCDTIKVNTSELRSIWGEATQSEALDSVPVSLDYLAVTGVLPSGEAHVVTLNGSFLIGPTGSVRPFISDLAPVQWPIIVQENSFELKAKGVGFSGVIDWDIGLFIDGVEQEIIGKWSPKAIFQVRVLDEDRICFAGNKGAFLVAKQQRGNAKGQLLLPSQETSAVVLDNDGGLWLSSLYGGLYYYPNSEALSMPIEDRLKGNLTCGAVDKNGAIWLGNYGGSCHRYTTDGTLQDLHIPGGYVVRTVSFDEKGRAWILSGGARGYFDETDVFRNVNFIGAPGVSSYARGLIALGNGRYLLGFDTYLGLFKLVQNSLVIEEVTRQGATQSMFSDGDSGAYVNFTDGLYHCKFAGDVSSCKMVSFGGEQVLVTAFALDPSTDIPQTIYARTQHHGLVTLSDGMVGIPFAGASKIPAGTELVFHEGNVYYSDGRRIQQVSMGSGQRTSFSESGTMPDGQLIGLFVANNALVAASGKELVIQDLQGGERALQPRFVQPKVAVNGHLLDSFPGAISLDGSNSTLTLFGDVLHFASQGGQTLRWQLLAQGDTVSAALAQTWICSDEGLNISNIAPGDYTLYGIPTSADGSPGDPFLLDISVARPFYFRWWFILLSGLTVIWASYLLFRRMTRRQRKQEFLEKRLLSLEQSALKARLNPHFLFNTLNGIQSLVISGNKVKTSNYVERFSTLMRGVLRGSGEQWVTLEQEFELLRVYLELEQFRFGENFRFEIEMDMGEYPNNSVLIPSMLLQPFVENAIVHGLAHLSERRVLHLSAKQVSSQRIEIIIKDNGVGREAARSINANRKIVGGFGTESVAQRIHLLNAVHSLDIMTQTIDLESGGTCVIITMPLLTDRAPLELISHEYN